MPQLMPLSWDYSILVVLMILMLKVMLYSNTSLHLNVMKGFSKKKLNWWW